MIVTFEHFMSKISFLIVVVHDSDITHYFDNSFGFQNNLIYFFSNKLFRSKTPGYGYEGCMATSMDVILH